MGGIKPVCDAHSDENEEEEEEKKNTRDADYVFYDSERGSGYYFGPGVTRAFCIENGVNMIIRSHQLKKTGWEYQNNTGEEQLLTLFSAPNYCGNVGNEAAFCTLAFETHQNILINIKTFRAMNSY
jgi:diadenosine tetraphosphatase ApaH/serine/threonine PP2A family protein phosphatase